MRDGVGMGQCGVGWGELGLKSLTHPHSAPWCRVKILPYPHPTTFVRREKPTWDEVGRGWSRGVRENCHP